jgi:hypothetical protein
MKRQLTRLVMTAVMGVLLLAPSAYLLAVTPVHFSRKIWVFPDFFVPLLTFSTDDMPTEQNTRFLSLLFVTKLFLTHCQ